jgi:glycosyltransferase involved in cell wall biosynthesis
VTDAGVAEPIPRRRAVVIVRNPLHPYSRALRFARTLANEGYAVEIAATAGDGLPAQESSGPIEIRRYPYAPSFQPNAGTGARGRAPRRGGMRGFVKSVRNGARRAVRRLSLSLSWPSRAVRDWWNELDRGLAPADIYHCCGIYAMTAALRARRRADPSHPPVVIYDAIDDFYSTEAGWPIVAPIRRLRALAEARAARSCDAIVTVNEGLASELNRRWRPRRPVVVVPNYPDVPTESGVRPDLIRALLGLSAHVPICLYQGRLDPLRRLDVTAEAVLLVPGAVFVAMGFGQYWDRSRERDRDPRFAGRHFTIPAVHPDELVDWTASADVAMVTFPGSTLNARLATPSKLWESLMAGTPIVVGPDHPLMVKLVQDFDAGRVATSFTPEGLAEAIRAVLSVSGEERVAWRARIRDRARKTYSWEVAAKPYLDLVHALAR